LPIDSYELRKRILSHIPYINEIVYMDKPIPYYIEKQEPDIIAIGFNQHYIKEYLEKNYSRLALLEVPGYNIDLYITSDIRTRKYTYNK
jgi:glycerol-3-phosphate cytidylyltransferase-like family protein